MSKWLGIQEVFEAKENISYGANNMRDGISSAVIIAASRHHLSRITAIPAEKKFNYFLVVLFI